MRSRISSGFIGVVLSLLVSAAGFVAQGAPAVSAQTNEVKWRCEP